jgi:hypothetical protein
MCDITGFTTPEVQTAVKRVLSAKMERLSTARCSYPVSYKSPIWSAYVYFHIKGYMKGRHTNLTRMDTKL